MTRKIALKEAIKLIETSRIGRKRKEEIIAGLRLCLDELPFAKWSEAAIFDACDQFVVERGHIRLRDFNCPALPSHPAVKNRFGMTAKEFRDKYYPLPDTPEFQPKYSAERRVEWNARFAEEFHRIRCTSGQHYNNVRAKEVPVWQTMCRLNGVKTWRELLALLELDTYGPVRPMLSSTVKL